MIGARRPVGAGDIEQRRQARPLALAHDGEAARDEGAIEADQRHDVGDGRQRDEIERGDKVGRRFGREEARLAQRPIERDEAHVDDARRAEMAEAGEIVLTVGIDDGDRVGQAFGRLMVIEHDDIEAERAWPPRKARG